MTPQRKNNITILKCPKCGYEIKVTEKVRKAYRHKSGVSEEKKRGVMVAEERRQEYNMEEIEELRRQLLENLQEFEKESD